MIKTSKYKRTPLTKTMSKTKGPLKKEAKKDGEPRENQKSNK